MYSEVVDEKAFDDAENAITGDGLTNDDSGDDDDDIVVEEIQEGEYLLM